MLFQDLIRPMNSPAGDIKSFSRNAGALRFGYLSLPLSGAPLSRNSLLAFALPLGTLKYKNYKPMKTVIAKLAHRTRMAESDKHPAKTRILVLEEHPLFRHGLSVFLNSQPDMIMCGEVDSIPRARSKIPECKPQLLLTALRVGTGDSLEFVKALRAEQPELLILVYSAFEESIFADRALRAGAHGYVMKNAPKRELVTAIREITRGEIYVSRDVAMRAFKKSLETRLENHLPVSTSTIENLSDREMHIFHLLGSGLGTRQIAHSLNLSVKTIQSHRENIKRKLDLKSSRDLVERATKYVEETFMPPKKEALSVVDKKKVVPFPAA
jgi:DNA-binding NarL/FixJ family response regulator